jgi:hypothetical protein
MITFIMFRDASFTHNSLPPKVKSTKSRKDATFYNVVLVGKYRFPFVRFSYHHQRRVPREDYLSIVGQSETERDREVER